jgi:hypothetical protein
MGWARGGSTIRAVSYYEVLGVAPDASPAAIRRAYVELARRYHPDFHTTESAAVRAANERAMQAVNEAWTVLSDPAARRRYDGQRAEQARNGGGANGHAAGHNGSAHGRRFERDPWRPFDDEDDADDDLDAMTFGDEPATVPVDRRRQLVTVLPVVTFFAGVFIALFGLVINLLPVTLLGLLAIAAAAVGVVVLPLFALSASARNDRR